MKKNCFLNHISLLALIIATICAFSFISMNKIDENIAYAEAEQFEIIEGMYDNYTNSDSLLNNSTKNINNYPTDTTLYRSTSNISRNNGVFSLSISDDDPIVQIVPKELFYYIGEHLYIGKEYGFFVKTIAESYDYKDANDDWQCSISDYNIKSTVIVFDINTLYDMVETIDRFIVSVTPLYQYEYAYIAPQASFLTLATTVNENRFDKQINYSIDTAMIVPIGLVNLINQINYEQVEKYYLKDISFASQLFNEQAPNDFYSEIYNTSNDIGSFFTGYDYSYDGIAIEDGSVVDNVILGLNEASYLLGAASTVVGFIPSVISPILGVASAVAGAPGFVINTVDLINGITSNNQISINSGTITAVPLYTTKAHQIANYGRLIKKAAIAINTGNDESIWYTSGSNATAYFTMSNSAGSLQSEYQTRIVREIGLHIIDENDNIQASSVSSYDYINGDNVIEPLTLEGNDNVYLLPEGNNYFSFFSQYASDYQLSIDVDANLIVYVNGNIITDSDNTYSFKLNSNTNNNIRIYNNDGIIIGPISIEPSSNLNNINVNSSGNYLIKQDINSDSYKKVVLSNESLQITNIFSLENGQLISYSFENQSIYGTDCLSIPITEGIKYFLLYNTNTTALTTNLSFENVNSLSVGSNSGNIERNWQYYKFTVPSSGSYAFSCAFTNASISMGIWNASFQKLDVIFSTNAIVIYDLMQNENIWVGLRNNALTEVNGTITANTTQNSFKWKLNNSNISGQSKSLERGSTYNLQFWINNDCRILDYEKINGSSYFSTNANGDITISETCPIATNIIQIRAFADNTHEVSYTYYLNITTTYETKIKITGQLNNQTQLGFSWQTYITGITAFKYTISSSSTIERSASVSGTSGSVDIFSYVSTSVATVNIIITKITLNGTERIYNSSTAQYANLSTRFKGGTGTEADPYLIDYPRHFNNIYLTSNSSNSNRNSIYYKQTNALHFGNTATRSGVEFYGYYDGNVKGIEEVNISSNGAIIGGLFDYNYGSISRIIYSNVIINATNVNAIVGGIVGENKTGGIISSPALAICNITACNYNGYTGGIAGRNEGSIIVGFAGGNILSKGDIGGIAGFNYGSINGGYCSTGITFIQQGTNMQHSIGGLVGRNDNTTLTITNCNYTGTILYGGMTYSDSDFNGQSSESRSLNPYIGVLVGFDLAESVGSSCGATGSVNIGTLHTVTWKGGFLNLKKYTWNQAANAEGNRRVGGNGW